MKEIENRIYVDDLIFNNEHSFVYGENSRRIVGFKYYNFVKDKESEEKRYWTYTLALLLARKRARDKRYKNYEFLITL